MAISHAIQFADGNAVRSANSKLDMDGTASFLTGTVVGLTIQTQLAGADVDASTAESYTSAAALTPRELMQAVVDDFNSKLTGAKVFASHQGGEEWWLRIQAIPGVADDVNISTPVFTAGV